MVRLESSWIEGYLSSAGVACISPQSRVRASIHAILLSHETCPFRWYAEDVERMPELEGLHKSGDALAALLVIPIPCGTLPTPSLVKLIISQAGDLSVSEPSPARIDQWVKLTVTPFDPFEAAPHFLCREVTCPKCSDTVSARSSPPFQICYTYTDCSLAYMTDGGTGYLQQGFLTRCPNKLCQFKITHDSLALRKLALDLSQHQRWTLPQHWLASVLISCFSMIYKSLTCRLQRNGTHPK